MLNMKKNTQSNQKMDQDMKKYFTKEEIQIVNTQKN